MFKIILFLFFILISKIEYAQSFVFAQLTGSPVLNTQGWNLNGNAYVGDTPGDVDNFNDELILTNAIGTQSGGVFFAQPLNLSLCSNWIVDFDYRIWGGNAADGLAFCFLQVPPVGFINGGGIGIPGTANGLKVVLDTWDNGCGANPELQIYNGVGYNECNAGIVKLTNTGGILNFIRGNTYRSVRIIYNNGAISLLINNILYLTANFPINFNGYMGFTAGTGGANDQHSIRNVIIYTAQATSNAGLDVQTCPNDNVSIGVANNPAFSYSWSPTIGLSNANVSNPTVNIPNNTNLPITQTYTVSTTLTTSPGVCPTTDQVVVTVNPSFISNLTETICDGSTYFFNGTPINSSGNYIDSLTTYSGCDSVVTLDIVFSNNPTVISPDLQICLGDSTLLIPSGATSYTWSPTVNFVDNLGQMWVNPTVTSNYVLQGTNLEGCIDLDTVIVVVNPLPNIQLIVSDNSVCFGSPVQFNASGGDSYSWTGQDLNMYIGDNQLINPLNSGMYVVIGTSVSGCTSSDSTFILVNPIPSISAIPESSEICFGEYVSFQILGADFYQWSNGQSSTIYTYQPLISESLTIIGTTTFGCTDTTQVAVIVHPNPIADFILDRNLLTSDDPTITISNLSSGNLVNLWDFGDGNQLVNNLNSIEYFYPFSEGDYLIKLTVSSIDGCMDSTEQLIQIKGDVIYYVPNCFTPDGDEFNNSFLPIFTSGFDPMNYELTIYNRWGEIVFVSENHLTAWNGSYNNLICPDGIYSYIIKYKIPDLDLFKYISGQINLIR
jgi:gliding motility-associated-like protein